MEQEDLFLFSFGDAGQAKLTAIAKVEPNLHHQDEAKALQGAGRGDGFSHHFKLLLEADPQAIAQEGHQDMSLDAALDTVPDGTDGQFAFEDAEGGFHFGKLHILTPEGVRIHGIEIGAQQVCEKAEAGSPIKAVCAAHNISTAPALSCW